jgi:hypothetical protein
MKTFQHQLWGYQINLPDNWNHTEFNHKDGFAEDSKAFLPDYQGERLAQLLINGEWNSLKQPIHEIWQGHMGKTALMLGAKNLGSAVWEMAGAQGYEVEIVLPKKSRERLWVGILENGLLVLTFLVLHWKDNREEMEPMLSRIISSLRYVNHTDGIISNSSGLPLPSLAKPVDPLLIVDDIQDPENWEAYQGEFSVGSLQAFYNRELDNFNWQVNRYVPFPNPGDLPFARLLLEKDGKSYSLGLMPGPEEDLLGYIMFKKNP